MKRKLKLWIFVLLLTLEIVAATGLRPAKTTLISEEGRDFSGQFWVVNNERMELKVDIYVEGDMSKYIKLKTTELRFRENDDAKPVDFEVHLPQEVPPGTSTAQIIVEEKISKNPDPHVISSKVLLKHKINIQGPYPDKYVTTKLNFHVDEKRVRLVSEVENQGKKNIDKIQTKFLINDKELTPIVLETEPTDLKQKENKLLAAEIDKQALGEGEFKVSAVTTYDDLKTEVVNVLLLGKPVVDITYFDRYFIANKINQYSLDLLNKWNKKVENVFVDVQVKKNQQKIDEFRTKSVDIEGEMTKRVNDYYNAEGKGRGEYSFDLLVNFWNTYRMETKTFPVKLLTEEEFKNLAQEEKANQENLAGKAPETKGGEEKSNLNLKLMLGLLLGVALLVAIFYIGWRYMHREEYE